MYEVPLFAPGKVLAFNFKNRVDIHYCNVFIYDLWDLDICSLTRKFDCSASASSFKVDFHYPVLLGLIFEKQFPNFLKLILGKLEKI